MAKNLILPTRHGIIAVALTLTITALSYGWAPVFDGESHSVSGRSSTTLQQLSGGDGPFCDLSFADHVVILDGTAFFTCNISAGSSVGGTDLWQTDGTPEGTKNLRNFFPPAYQGVRTSFKNLTKANGYLFFNAWSGLWRTDGTAAGTVLLKAPTYDVGSNTHYGAGQTIFMGVGSTLFFADFDDAHGVELWKSDGTREGTTLLKDLNLGARDSWVRPLTAVGHSLKLMANNDQLWTSDGTSSGTSPFARIPWAGVLPLRSPVAVNGILFFLVDVPTGVQLWKSDGTDTGTSMVKELVSADNLTDVDGTLFFTSDDNELWKSDGCEEGTIRVKDLRSDLGLPYVYPASLTNVDGTLFFTAHFSTFGNVLWKSDGTEDGTSVVDPDVRVADGFYKAGGSVIFMGSTSVPEFSIGFWSSDGTPAAPTSSWMCRIRLNGSFS